MKRTFSPIVLNCLRFPDRNPSPRPTRSRSEPTPQAMPNIVRKERSLCAQSVRSVWPKISNKTRMDFFPSYGKRAKFTYIIECGIPHLTRSEEHTSELQSRRDLVCRLLL